MSSFTPLTFHDPGDDRTHLRRALAALALFAGFVALFAFAPPDDPTKVVAGLPCSVLSENEVAGVVGTPMRLMPTSGAICHYLPSQTESDAAVFVVAHHDASLSGRLPNGAVAVHAGPYVYTIAVVGRDAARPAPSDAAQRLAKLVQRPIIAANR